MMKNQRSGASSRANHAFCRCRQAALAALFFCAVFAPASFAQEAAARDAGLRQIRSYITAGWDTLTRSLTACTTFLDPQLVQPSVFHSTAYFASPPAGRAAQIQRNLHS